MRRQSFWTRSALARTILAAIVVAAAAAYQAFDRFKLYPEAVWLHNSAALFWSVVAAGIIVVTNTVGDEVSKRAAIKDQGRRVDIYKGALSALAVISQETGVIITQLGANVFVVDGKRSKRLSRVERIRLADVPGMSKVSWTDGKGVIGRCWKNKRIEHEDLSAKTELYGGRDITDDEWASMDAAQKNGFSKEEFVEMVGKYSEILAIPLRSTSGGVIGCVAFDRRWEGVRTPSVLNTPAVRDIGEVAAGVLQKVVTER